VPTVLARPRGWAAVLLVAAVTVAAVVWSVAGSLPRTVTAPGLLTHPGGVVRVQSLWAGQVREVRVAPGAAVSAGQVVAVLADTAGRARQVASPYSGRVVDVTVAGGQVLGVGTAVLTVERTDLPGDRLLAMVLVPEGSAAGIAPGQTVDLSVSSAPPQAFGVLRGRVSAVSDFPLSADALAALLGGPDAAAGYGAGRRLVTVDLEPARTPSGYRWSTEAGYPRPLASQATVSATITVGSQAPIRFVLGR
jgi:multidrug efflux pump subunit AcrA (membrane-fusion protein)